MSEVKIKMGDYLDSGSHIFTGRDRGIEARKKSRLDELEEKNDKIIFLFPPHTWGINPSFYGGLMEVSIKKLRDTKIFEEKYVFMYYDGSELNDSLRADLREDLQYVLNSIEE